MKRPVSLPAITTIVGLVFLILGQPRRIGHPNGQFAHLWLQLSLIEPSPNTEIAQRRSSRREIAAQARRSGSNTAVQQLKTARANAAVHPPAQAARSADSPGGEVELKLRRR